MPLGNKTEMCYYGLFAAMSKICFYGNNSLHLKDTPDQLFWIFSILRNLKNYKDIQYYLIGNGIFVYLFS